MDNSKPTPAEQGEILNTLAGILFTQAGKKWYAAAAIEIVVGIVSALVLLFDLSPTAGWVVALAGFLAYVLAYYLRILSETQHSQAETMRRQSVLSEALGWELSQAQLSEWRQRAGKKAVADLDVVKRPADYYATKSTDPSERLSHMTSESAFYTRYLYRTMSALLWKVAGAALLITLIALTGAFLVGDRAVDVSTLVLAVLTILISADIVGWAFRLQGMQHDVYEIECDFERLGKSGDRKLEYVMRLVGEYNCVVVMGIPIHSWWFNRHHDDINKEWQEYIKGNGKLPG